MTYDDYLRSDHWKNLKAEKFSQVGRICNRCGSDYKIQVHHRVYRVSWFDSVTDDLEVLCKRCHKKAHGLKVPKYHAQQERRHNQRKQSKKIKARIKRIELDSRNGNSHYIIFPTQSSVGAVSPTVVTVGPLIESKPQSTGTFPSRESGSATSKSEELCVTGFTADLTPTLGRSHGRDSKTESPSQSANG